jgi:hypothetical protein
MSKGMWTALAMVFDVVVEFLTHWFVRIVKGEE